MYCLMHGRCIKLVCYGVQGLGERVLLHVQRIVLNKKLNGVQVEF